MPFDLSPMDVAVCSGKNSESPAELAANLRCSAEGYSFVSATIVRCNCGAEYKRTEAKFLVPHTGHASCKVCGATLESWLESTHVATFELIKRPDRKPV